MLAYTLPSKNYIVNCPLFFSDLPALTSECHEQDQASTTLHEMAHAPGVFSPGTEDLGYGYQAATALSASQALDNADSYALFSNGTYFLSGLLLWIAEFVANLFCDYSHLCEVLDAGNDTVYLCSVTRSTARRCYV